MPIANKSLQVRMIGLAGAFALLIGSGAVYGQQTGPNVLSLADAVSIALDKSPTRKMAVADTSSAKASIAEAGAPLLPRLSFSQNITVGNDPVYVFGTRLRQGRFTSADFGLSALNSPNAVANYASRLEGHWTAFDSFATVSQRHKAVQLHVASQQALTRVDQELIYNVVSSYYGWLLALKQVDLAEQAVTTAASLLTSSSNSVDAGMAVDSDALSARVNLAVRQQELIRAKSGVSIAKTEVESRLGAELPDGERPIEVMQDQVLPTLDLHEIETRAARQRPDLMETATEVSAQQNGVKSAKAAFGPRVDVYGAYEADNPHPTGGGSTNWMTGAELRIDIFSREDSAKLATQRAMLSHAEAQAQVAQDNVRLEVRRAYYEHDATRQMLQVSKSSIAQATESLRITRDRYESGLTTITELLRAEDAERVSKTNYWQSVYRYMLSYADLQLASGDLSPQSPVVTQ